MGSESKADTKTTTQNLTPEQQSLVGLALPEYQKFAASDPTLPGGAGVSPFDPLQSAGQQQVLDAVPAVAKTVGMAADTNNRIAGGEFLDPGNNPVVQNAVKAATAPIYDQLHDTTLPGISAGASTGAGGMSANFGGSRQGIAEGLASKGASEAAGRTGAGIVNTALGQGLSATNTAIGQAPATAASLTVPGTVTSTVGDVREQKAQQVLSADQQAKQFAQFLPMLKAQMLTGGAGSLPGGSTTAVGTGNTDANPISQIIGLTAALAGVARAAK